MKARKKKKKPEEKETADQVARTVESSETESFYAKRQ